MIRISLPGKLREKKVQLASLFSRENGRAYQGILWREFSMRLIPRYLDDRLLHWKPIIMEMWSWTEGAVLRKIIWDLAILVSIPRAKVKRLKIF